MTNNILLCPISLDELEERIVARFKKEILSPSPTSPATDTENLLTSKEVSKLLGVSLMTLSKWRKGNKIKYHRFGTRIRYNRSEILNTQKYGRATK